MGPNPSLGWNAPLQQARGAAERGGRREGLQGGRTLLIMWGDGPQLGPSSLLSSQSVDQPRTGGPAVPLSYNPNLGIAPLCFTVSSGSVERLSWVFGPFPFSRTLT